jgi:hypothetical protein
VALRKIGLDPAQILEEIEMIKKNDQSDRMFGKK